MLNPSVEIGQHFVSEHRNWATHFRCGMLASVARFRVMWTTFLRHKARCDENRILITNYILSSLTVICTMPSPA